jgi:signal transduction histidine kinase
MSRLDLPGPAGRIDPRKFARHAAIVAGFSALVGIGLSIAKGGDFVLQLVYAEAIGLSIWACTDFGRFLFRRDPETDWPAGWRAVVLQVGAVVIGYLAGTWIGDRYCDCSTFEMWRRSGRIFAGYLVLSIGITAAITFFFLARGRDQRRLRSIAMAERDASEARLKLLESQLEPHMLFNTLANLRALIETDPARAQAMLDQLIAFLRATLSASRQPFHPLAAEFARIGDYLQLMQVRMGARLQTRLVLPEALAGLAVPPLLLQPLVENAIKHGLEPHVGGGRLEVSAERAGERVLLSVRDTGSGLAPAIGDNGERFGLAQVRQRLATVYGDAASLVLAPARDAEGGSCATIAIPMVRVRETAA